jgi:hypothetical protein
MSGPVTTPYGVRGRGQIRAWQDAYDPDQDELDKVIGFIRKLMQNPGAVACAKAQGGTGLPIFFCCVEGTNTQVSWQVLNSPPYSEEFRCIWLIEIAPARS